MRLLAALIFCSLAQAQPESSLAHFRLAEADLAEGRLQPALNEFRETLSGDLTPKWTEVWAHINLGKIFNRTGNCSRAVSEYNLAAATDDDTFGTQREVDDYLKSNIVHPPIRLPERTTESNVPGPDITSPVAQTHTQPEYSEAARRAGLEGTVLLEALIADDGAVSQIRVTRPLGLGLDENALQAVRQWKFKPGSDREHAVPVLINIPVDFFLPARQSLWHLAGLQFHPTTGTSAPSVFEANYPSGAGIAPSSVDDAKLLNAMGRLAGARLSFDIDETGAPVRLQVERASNATFGAEATAVIQNWKFTPAMKDGTPVAVPATADLVWGVRNLTASPLPTLSGLTRPDSQPSSSQACR